MAWAYGTQKGSKRQSFTVPVTSGNYAPEILYCAVAGAQATPVTGEFDDVAILGQVIEVLPAGAAIEVDILAPGLDPTVDGNWIKTVATNSSTGLKALLQLGSWRGVRIRAKSGGTAGTAIVSGTWS